MSNMDLKVGMKVRVKAPKDAPDAQQSPRFTSDMHQYIGCVYTVERVHRGGTVELMESNDKFGGVRCYLWHTRWLVPVECTLYDLL